MKRKSQTAETTTTYKFYCAQLHEIEGLKDMTAAKVSLITCSSRMLTPTTG
ncbi:hypothetical protein L208DRAFT_1388407 [Tricholoma matsutake]|nr:hypothetical protein L208DRAFT_1388407 [Tricholoma matsutake 945]